MSLYNIDYDLLPQLLITKRLRGVRMLSWLGALIAPVKTIYGRFMAFRKAKTYELEHNSQVCRLEAVINDEYDPGLRRLKVVDTPEISPTFFYTEAEDKPGFIYTESEATPKYYYTEAETYQGADFIVQVPSFIAFDTVKLSASVSKYKLPGRTFIIQII